jgi:hypothetical protein
VNLRDVRMIQPGECFRFALEARHARGIARHGRGQHLDGDSPFQIGVRRSIHLAHAALANEGGNLVRTNARPWRERHDVRAEPP